MNTRCLCWVIHYYVNLSCLVYCQEFQTPKVLRNNCNLKPLKISHGIRFMVSNCVLNEWNGICRYGFRCNQKWLYFSRHLNILCGTKVNLMLSTHGAKFATLWFSDLNQIEKLKRKISLLVGIFFARSSWRL